MIFTLTAFVDLTAAPPAAQKPAETQSQTEEAKPAVKSAAELKKEADAVKRAEAEKRRVEFIEKTITFGTSSERKDSIRAISSIKDEAKKKQLVTIMLNNLKNETDTGVIITSCRSAADINERSAIPIILTFLENESEDVRIEAVYALKKLEAKETSATLIDQLKKQDFKKDSNYTEALLQTLAEFEVSSEFDFIKTKFEDPETSRNNRLAMLLYLGNSKTASSEEFLRGIFEDESEDLTTRAYAVSSISKIGASAAIPSISKVADEIDKYPVKKRADYYELYIHCISALVRLGDKGAYPKLEKALKSDSAAMRLKAITLIKELKDPRAIEILKYKAEYDPSDKVQAEAKSVLKETFNIDMEKKTADSDKTIQNASAGTDGKENSQ